MSRSTLEIAGFGQKREDGKITSWFDLSFSEDGSVHKVLVPNELYAEFDRQLRKPPSPADGDGRTKKIWFVVDTDEDKLTEDEPAFLHESKAKERAAQLNAEPDSANKYMVEWIRLDENQAG